MDPTEVLEIVGKAAGVVEFWMNPLALGRGCSLKKSQPGLSRPRSASVSGSGVDTSLLAPENLAQVLAGNEKESFGR